MPHCGSDSEASTHFHLRSLEEMHPWLILLFTSETQEQVPSPLPHFALSVTC